MQKGKVVSVNVSKERAEKKHNVGSCKVVKGKGLAGDGHYGFMHRQISILSMESIEKMRRLGLSVGPGDFAENITLEGFDMTELIPGDRLKIGENVIVRVTQIGKECRERCAIYYQAGDCIMPKEGVFAEVLNDGEIKVGDEVVLLK